MTSCRMNPPIESPNLVEPAGPTDPEVAVVSVQSPEGRPIALLANYSLHYVGTGRDEEISADYYGAFADRIQQLLGADRLDPPFVALLSNGTSGDINNINFRHKRAPLPPYEQIRAVAGAVAAEAHRVCQTLQYQGLGPAGRAANGDQTRRAAAQPGGSRPRRGDARQAKGAELKSAEQVYARETVLMKDYPEAGAAHHPGDAHRGPGHRGDSVRGVCGNRAGDQAAKPVQADLHHRAGQRLQRLPAHAASSTSSAATRPGGPAQATWKPKPRRRSSTP